ncbi:MAG: hypothetical protein HY815_32315 [Candidatus Riflebacteria bacterium]|nr:hypothetical protein [Candidatus Riflebacteria bacterium]
MRKSIVLAVSFSFLATAALAQGLAPAGTSAPEPIELVGPVVSIPADPGGLSPRAIIDDAKRGHVEVKLHACACLQYGSFTIYPGDRVRVTAAYYHKGLVATSIAKEATAAASAPSRGKRSIDARPSGPAAAPSPPAAEQTLTGTVVMPAGKPVQGVLVLDVRGKRFEVIASPRRLVRELGMPLAAGRKLSVTCASAARADGRLLACSVIDLETGKTCRLRDPGTGRTLAVERGIKHPPRPGSHSARPSAPVDSR